MRRAVQVGIATVAASAALAGGAALATGDHGGHPNKKGPHSDRFVLIAQAQNVERVNVGDPAMGPGDYSILRYDKLTEGKQRTDVGDSFAMCVVQFPPAGFQCEIVTRLDGRGTLTLNGVTAADIREDFTMAVTGGTGDFRNARGEVLVESVSLEPFVQRATYDLIGVR